jgi:hypothetical protein
MYRGVLHFTDHTPARISTRDPGDYEREEDGSHDVQVMQWVEPEPGAVMTLEQEVFVEEAAYAPCFTYVVYGPSGHVAQTSACLPVLSPEEIQALANNESPAAEDDVAAEQDQQPSADTRDRRDNPPFVGCAIDPSSPIRAPARPAGSTLLVAACVASAALRRYASRRPQPGSSLSRHPDVTGRVSATRPALSLADRHRFRVPRSVVGRSIRLLYRPFSEREKGFEPSTPSLGSLCSTN